MRMLKLAAVDLDYRAGIPKQNLRGGFHDARLSGPRGTEEQKTAYRAPRRVQTGTEDLVRIDHRLHRFLLPHDLGAQCLLKLHRLRTTSSRIENQRLCAHVTLLTNAPLGGRLRRKSMISFHLHIEESVLAGSMPNSCNGAAWVPFKAGLAYLLHVLWPVNLALFKPSPHVFEPTWAGQSSERRCGQTCGPCGLDRGPLILHSWPLSPNAKLSLECGPCNPGNAPIERWKIPRFHAG